MTFREFEQAFSDYLVIPVIEVEKSFPGFDRNSLTRLQKKGYIEKLRQGYYRISSNPISSEAELFLLANKVYHPSYVSLQSAMRWYDFIPEGVFITTSISTQKTIFFKTTVGSFQFRSIKRDLFFGYRLEKVKKQYFKIAAPEKALLDYFYLSSNLDSLDDLHELRLNIFELKEKIDWEKMNQMLHLFNTKALNHRILLLKKYLDSYDIATRNSILLP